MYADMMRRVIYAGYELAGKNIPEPSATIQLDGETINLFRHPSYDMDVNIDASFSMLFIGYSFDQARDLPHTIMDWNSR